MTERGHDSNQPLLQKNDGKRNLSTRLKISLFAFLGGVAIEMRSISQTQFVYSYLKNHADINNTVSNGNTNITSEQDGNCQGNSTSTNDDYIQGLASDWTWYIQLVIYSIGLPIVIIAGPLSDRIGRKTLVVYNLVLSSISFSARTYVVYAKLNLNWFLLSCGVEGLAGSHYVFHFALCAMLADCTTSDKHRSFALTVYDTMLGIGVCCSQVATGYLIKDTNFTYPFLISTVLTMCVLILFLFAITEGNRFSKNENSTASSSKYKLICALWTNTNSLVRSRRKSLFIYFLTFGLHHFPLTANNTIRTLYTLGWPFCWSSIQIGWYGAGSHFVEYVFGILILKYSLLCMRDETITILGFVSTIACFVLFGFSTNDLMIYTGKIRLNFTMHLSIMLSCFQNNIKS